MTTPDKLIIFDCDGVLVDSELIAWRVEAGCLTEAGFPMTAEDIRRDFVGISAAAAAAMIEERFRRPLPSTFKDDLLRRTLDAFETELHPVAGVPDLVQSLDVPVCVASSSLPSRIRKALSLTGQLDLFEPNIFSAVEVTNGKPAPDLFLHAASRTGFEPSSCLVVEDSRAGVQAGVAAGMQMVGFTAGSHCDANHADILRAAGAGDIASSALEMEGMIARWLA